MHRSTHALLSCVALLSLLCNAGHADAGKAPPPSEVLSHFARTVGSVLGPTFSAELQRPNRSASYQRSATTTPRQVDTRQISSRNAAGNSAGDEGNAGAANAAGNLAFPGQAFPYQYERTYSYRYPPFSQQLSQSFFPGASSAFDRQLLPNAGLPFDPALFQSQPRGNPQLAAADQQGPAGKGVSVSAKMAEASDGNVKASGIGNVNTLENLELNADSKSSAQNRPFDNADFPSIPNEPGQAGANLGLDPNGGHLRVDNRFSAIDYERIRQNYYSDPPINQRYYSSFNEIPFSGGPPYRSPLPERFSNLDFSGVNGAGRAGGPSSDSRLGNGGLGHPYFANFFQGPYQSLNYNNIPGGGNGAAVGGSPNNDRASFENFDRASQSFRSPFGLQYPAGFAGPGSGANFQALGVGADFGAPSGDGGFLPSAGFGREGDSSLRASTSKQSVARPVAPQSSEENRPSIEQLNGSDERERIDRQQKVGFVDNNDKPTNSERREASVGNNTR